MASTQQIKCPQCGNRFCDRTPSGYAAGWYRCRICKLEMIMELTALSEVTLVVVPPELTADLVSSFVRRLDDGRGLVPWDIYKRQS